MSLPAEVRIEDDRLEREEGTASELLAKHRWHWTLNEANPQHAVSITEYAEHVGRSRQTIEKYVHAYQKWINRDESSTRTCAAFVNFILAEQMTKNRKRAVEAVAQVTGEGQTTISRLYKADVDEVQAEVGEYQSTHPEATDEQVWAVAVAVATAVDERHSITGLRAETERKKKDPGNYPRALRVLTYMQKARKALNEAMEIARTLDHERLDESVLAYINIEAEDLIALATLTRQAVDDNITVDWDGELLKLHRG